MHIFIATTTKFMQRSSLTNKKTYFLKFSLFFLFLISLSFYQTAKAADGCYVSGVLYASHTKSGAYFYRTPNTVATCGVTGTISGSCRLYNSGNINNNSSYTQYGSSYSSNISAIAVCPLDDYVWVLIVAVMGVLFFRFKNNTSSIYGFS